MILMQKLYNKVISSWRFTMKKKFDVNKKKHPEDGPPDASVDYLQFQTIVVCPPAN